MALYQAVYSFDSTKIYVRLEWNNEWFEIFEPAYLVDDPAVGRGRSFQEAFRNFQFDYVRKQDA